MTSAVDSLNKDGGIPKAVFPVMGGLTVGVIALVYPEVLYWGFQNVDILLEKRPFVKGLSADLLLQLVAVKIAATAWCRASGLVGGYYAPSLFIGGAAGMAYGKFIGIALAQNPEINLSILEVASPQAYGLVLFLCGQCFKLVLISESIYLGLPAKTFNREAKISIFGLTEKLMLKFLQLHCQ